MVDMRKPKASHRTFYGQGSFKYSETKKLWRGVIEAGLDANGKRKRIEVSSRNEDEAWRKFQAKIKEVEAGKINPGTSNKTTIKKWAEEWLEVKRHKLAPSTFESYSIAVNKYIIPYFGKMRLSDITGREFTLMAKKMRDAGATGTTINYYQGRFKSLLKDAQKTGYQVQESAVVAERATKSKNNRDAIELVDAGKLLDTALTHDDGSKWIVSFLQGLRQGERLGMQWPQLDFKNDLIIVDRQLVELVHADKAKKTFMYPDGKEYIHLRNTYHLGPPKSESGNRVIPMIPYVKQILLAWREIAPESEFDFVWPRENGMILNKKMDMRQWRALQQEAGVAKYPELEGNQRYYVTHEIRNTTATLLMELGIDSEIIKGILGHADITTSRRYMRVNSEQMGKALSGIAGLLGLNDKRE